MLKAIHLYMFMGQKEENSWNIIYDGYVNTKKAIDEALNDKEVEREVHTSQPHFLSFQYLPARLFVHVRNNSYDEEIHEITLGSCDGTDKELREAHNLEKLLLGGAFDWFKE
ncbi:hypothetical protein DXA62_06320 [Coprobacillus sp. OF03-2AA]|nr:hypothetical protein DXA62_06320 [Coprobacillus sp. OF03-2AA]